VRWTFVVLVWFRITLTAFLARITTVFVFVKASYAQNTIGSFFPDTVYVRRPHFLRETLRLSAPYQRLTLVDYIRRL